MITAEIRNRILMMMLATKSCFSNPRFVWNDPPVWLPPKALPRLASFCCNKTAPVNKTERIICIQGKKLDKDDIGNSVAQ